MGRCARQIGLGALMEAVLGALRLQVSRVLPMEIDPGGPLLLPTLTGVMALAGLLAAWLPARRALRIHPVEALRPE